LEELDANAQQGPYAYKEEEPEEFHRRYQEFYRLVTHAMRMLQLHADVFPPVNDIAFFDRAMQMIRENDQRPWDVLREELKVELQKPILLRDYSQHRHIDLDSSTSSSSANRAQLPSDESRQIHIPADGGANSESHP
jgi:hypothetical protein